MIQPGDALILDQQVHTTVQIASGIAAAKNAKLIILPQRPDVSDPGFHADRSGLAGAGWSRYPLANVLNVVRV
jgi:hypothetical protein